MSRLTMLSYFNLIVTYYNDKLYHEKTHVLYGDEIGTLNADSKNGVLIIAISVTVSTASNCLCCLLLLSLAFSVVSSE